ncbi:hypothetical protein [Nocardia sp. NPDC051750]|uniref:hypothetical protein n=1 Tax=Nocardia sp. NPDC051750 TaxID=3364325 RepID=UPI0037A4093C
MTTTTDLRHEAAATAEALAVLVRHAQHVADAVVSLDRAMASGHITRIVSALAMLHSEIDILAGVLGPHARAGRTIPADTARLVLDDQH